MLAIVPYALATHIPSPRTYPRHAHTLATDTPPNEEHARHANCGGRTHGRQLALYRRSTDRAKLALNPLKYKK